MLFQLEHPGLLALQSDDPSLIETRWELFCDVVDPSGDLRPPLMRKIDPLNLTSFVSLFAIARFRPAFLLKWEAQAFLAQHFELKAHNRSSALPVRCPIMHFLRAMISCFFLFQRIVLPERVSSRSVGLASMYLEVPVGDLDWAVGHLTWPDSGAGESLSDDVEAPPDAKFQRHHLMDGLLLHRIYAQFEEAQSPDDLWAEKVAAMELEEDRSQAKLMLQHIVGAMP